jgi:hypothetical protein
MLFVVLLVRPSRSAREAFDAILGEVTFFATLSLLDLVDPSDSYSMVKPAVQV